MDDLEPTQLLINPEWAGTLADLSLHEDHVRADALPPVSEETPGQRDGRTFEIASDAEADSAVETDDEASTFTARDDGMLGSGTNSKHPERPEDRDTMKTPGAELYLVPEGKNEEENNGEVVNDQSVQNEPETKENLWSPPTTQLTSATTRTPTIQSVRSGLSGTAVSDARSAAAASDPIHLSTSIGPDPRARLKRRRYSVADDDDEDENVPVGSAATTPGILEAYCKMPRLSPVRVIGDELNSVDADRLRFSNANEFEIGEIVAVPRRSGALNYGRVIEIRDPAVTVSPITGCRIANVLLNDGVGIEKLLPTLLTAKICDNNGSRAPSAQKQVAQWMDSIEQLHTAICRGRGASGRMTMSQQFCGEPPRGTPPLSVALVEQLEWLIVWHARQMYRLVNDTAVESASALRVPHASTVPKNNSGRLPSAERVQQAAVLERSRPDKTLRVCVLAGTWIPPSSSGNSLSSGPPGDQPAVKLPRTDTLGRSPTQAVEVATQPVGVISSTALQGLFDRSSDTPPSQTGGGFAGSPTDAAQAISLPSLPLLRVRAEPGLDRKLPVHTILSPETPNMTAILPTTAHDQGTGPVPPAATTADVDDAEEDLEATQLQVPCNQLLERPSDHAVEMTDGSPTALPADQPAASSSSSTGPLPSSQSDGVVLPSRAPTVASVACHSGTWSRPDPAASAAPVSRSPCFREHHPTSAHCVHCADTHQTVRLMLRTLASAVSRIPLPFFGDPHEHPGSRERRRENDEV